MAWDSADAVTPEPASDIGVSDRPCIAGLKVAPADSPEQAPERSRPKEEALVPRVPRAPRGLFCFDATKWREYLIVEFW